MLTFENRVTSDQCGIELENSLFFNYISLNEFWGTQTIRPY